MSVARSVAEVLRDHVVLEVEAIDRMYLNVYVPHLQSVGAVVGYLRVHRGQRFASTTAVTPMTEAFVRNIDQFVNDEGVDLVAFKKGQRKDDVTQKYVRKFTQREGVLYVGKAQEKARVMRTERRCSRFTGGTYPWIVESTAMVNHYYFYCVDEDFGPFFLKFCSYFPYNAKLCINGNEYLKRQLAKRGGGVRGAGQRRQVLCQPQADAAVVRRAVGGQDRSISAQMAATPAASVSGTRSLRRLSLPALHPAGRVLAHPGARPAGDGAHLLRGGDPREPRYRPPQPSELGVRPQGEPPHTGAIPHTRHNRRRSAFAARRQKTRIKQYHKEGQALRTETTINDTRDFAIGRRIENLEQLRKIGFAANRRLLDVQRIGHDCFIGEASFQDMQRPITVNDQRAAALRFADPRVQALLHVLLLFLLVQGTFTSKDLREHLAPLLGKKPSQLTPGRITYDLRRLRLHGLTERISKTHRYRITPKGLRTAIFYTRLYNRSLRTGLAIISPGAANPELPMAKSIRAAETAINKWYQHEKLAA